MLGMFERRCFKIFTLLNKGDKLYLNLSLQVSLPQVRELRQSIFSNIETIANEMRKETGVEDVRFFKDAVNRF